MVRLNRIYITLHLSFTLKQKIVLHKEIYYLFFVFFMGSLMLLEAHLALFFLRSVFNVKWRCF